MIEGIKFISGLFLNIVYRIEHINMDNVPKSGSGIMCSNHISDIDMFLIGYKLKRLIRYMAKEELFKIPILGWFIAYCGSFPVRRGSGDIGAIKKAFDLIDEGHIIGIFPEGKRTKNKTKLRAKPGPALIAMKTGAKIIPVKIEGKMRIFSKIKIIYGKPYIIEFEKDKKYTNKELVEISQKILDNIYSMSEDGTVGDY